MSEVLPVSGIFFYGDAILLQYVSASFLTDSDRLSRWHSERCRTNDAAAFSASPHQDSWGFGVTDVGQRLGISRRGDTKTMSIL
jgi:hypothetical protein